MIKRYFYISAIFLNALILSGCSTNPATGENQFTALMSPQQETQVGAQEHEKIVQQYGLYKNQTVQQYVSDIGRRVAKHTERPEVEYKFFVIDSPIVNAFALPGGYIYMSRGLLALANSEAEMASVLAHETGHITARHSAERYSRGVVTSLGAMVISAAVGNQGVSQALGIGSDLYLKSYSRGQESQADGLGIRYLVKSGYTPKAMAGFLSNLQADTSLEAKIEGKQDQSASYFSTHPATEQRVQDALTEAGKYPQKGVVNADSYLLKLAGMTYGDSAEQGFVRGSSFYHPKLGFKFSVPAGYSIANQPSQVVAASKTGGVIIFDFAANKDGAPPLSYIRDIWMKGQKVESAENIKVNGMPAATATIQGNLNGKTMQIRLIAIKWAQDQIVRFQIAMPSTLSSAELNALKSTTYSFNRLTPAEKNSIKPYRLKIISAKAGDSVASLAKGMAQKDYKEDRFRVLNGLSQSERLVVGKFYKIVVE